MRSARLVLCLALAACEQRAPLDKDAAVDASVAMADGPEEADAAEDAATPEGDASSPSDAPVPPVNASLADARPPDAPPDAAPFDPGRRLLYRADGVTDDVIELFLATFDATGPNGAVRVGPSPGDGTRVNFYEWAPNGLKALYTTYGREQQVYLIDLSAAEPAVTQRANGELSSDGYPPLVGRAIWSPDSRRILYNSDEGIRGDYELWLVDVSGATPATPQKVNAPLVFERDIFDFHWSPDGRWVAYGTLDETGGVLYVVDVSGATPGTPHLVGNGSAETAAWSPDGAWIAFHGPDASRIGQLYVAAMGPAGPAAPVRVNDPMPEYRSGIYDFQWSPDAAWLSWRADPEEYDHPRLFAARMGGSAPGPQVQVNALPAAYPKREPRWAPDGSKILFEAWGEATSASDFYVVDMSAGTPGPTFAINPAAVTPSENAIGAPNYRWSPDSAAIAFIGGTSTSNPSVYVVDVASLPPREAIAVTPGLTVPETVTPYQFPWSSDAAHLLYRAYLDFRFELWSVDVSTPAPWSPVKMNGPLVLGGEVSFYAVTDANWAWVPWANEAVYLADQQTLDRIELWWSNGAGDVRRVNAPLTPYGDVVDFKVRPW